MPGIDLHTHSTASDGCLAPAELLRLARETGLEALALTDHDTVAGLDEARAAAAREGVEFVPGCELSVLAPVGFVHILGLYLPPRPARLIQAMEVLQEGRHARNRRMVDKLNALGCSLSYDEVQELAGQGSVGRPHLARVLQDKGYVSSVQQAFTDYLGRGGRAFVPKDMFTPETALELLRAEGATPVLAHPFSLRQEGFALERRIRAFMDHGLEGLECLYPEHSPEQTAQFLRLARKLDLLVTGGSDFHGPQVKPDIRLGVGTGGLKVPRALLERMQERRAARGLPC